MFDFEISGIHLDENLVRSSAKANRRAVGGKVPGSVTTSFLSHLLLSAEERGGGSAREAAGLKQSVSARLTHAQQDCEVGGSSASAFALRK